jgi:chorismate synthase
MRRDENGAGEHLSNNAGGIEGGVSNGNEIVARIALKPTPSILKNQKSIDKEINEIDVSVKGRHDPCVVPRAVPVAEAMVAITLADHLLRQRAARV